ncbi:MAG TPA: hypothetical protein EYG03_12535 [Planctomycetes bacterium]|nr:hypothetical protein [Fuerstiella sp.]HIK92790.1 hypothetical protein [Planctomycetota bacterium]
MTRYPRTAAVLNCLAVASMLLSQSLTVSADPLTTTSGLSSTAKPIRDIRMHDGGLVMIHVLDDAGKTLPHRIVTITHQGHIVATARSNNGGQIRVSGLRAGIHLLTSGQSMVALRLWAADVAPPSATDSTAIVVSQQIVRGQYGAPMVGPGMLVTGAGIAGLVVVVAGKNSSDDSVPVPPADSTDQGTEFNSDGSTAPASP